MLWPNERTEKLYAQSACKDVNQSDHAKLRNIESTLEMSGLATLAIAGGSVEAGSGASLGEVMGLNCGARPKTKGCCPQRVPSTQYFTRHAWQSIIHVQKSVTLEVSTFVTLAFAGGPVGAGGGAGLGGVMGPDCGACPKGEGCCPKPLGVCDGDDLGTNAGRGACIRTQPWCSISHDNLSLTRVLTLSACNGPCTYLKSKAAS